MGEKQLKQQDRLKSLRIVHPSLYSMIVEELEKQKIHSYDVQMFAAQTEEGMQLAFRFGGNFSYEKRKFFSHDVLKHRKEEIIEFAEEIGKTCEEVLRNEYFKLMRP